MKQKLLFVPLVLCLLFAACRKKTEPAVDPCKDKTPFKAAISIAEKVGDTSFVSGKALAPGYVYFDAIGSYDSVRWYVGGPQNTSAKTRFSLYFQQPEGDVDVTFIGYRKPNTLCFPNDKASDTVQQTITILPRDEKAGIVGRFQGYNESNPADTFSVEISYVNYNNGYWSYYIKNLPNGCPGYTSSSEEHPHDVGLEIAAGYSGFRVNEASVQCATVDGIGRLVGNDSLKIDYSYYPRLSANPYDFGPKKSDKFIGVRKQ